jgi:RNA polymerase sigma-70 factor (ECF subfamily)
VDELTAISPTEPAIDEIWREHRPYLLSVAFRMLGNIADAEDVVQDAFARMLRFDRSQINDVRGWLVVVVSRLCLDHLGTARVRRESQQPHEHPAFAVNASDADPADRVTLDDNVRTALLVVLATLSPAERTAFVLHEVFQYPFETIGEIVGRTPAACRQLASRARRRVDADDASRFIVEPAAEREVAEEFAAACAGGEIDRLLALLDPDVVGHAELRPPLMTAPERRGREDVGRNLLRFLGPHVTLIAYPIDGHAGALAFRNGRLAGIVSFTTRAGKITDIHVIADPYAFGAM